MITDCIGRRFPEKKVKAMRDELSSLGVEYRESDLINGESNT